VALTALTARRAASRHLRTKTSNVEQERHFVADELEMLVTEERNGVALGRR
jgi:hypothetical protein